MGKPLQKPIRCDKYTPEENTRRKIQEETKAQQSLTLNQKRRAKRDLVVAKKRSAELLRRQAEVEDAEAAALESKAEAMEVGDGAAGSQLPQQPAGGNWLSLPEDCGVPLDGGCPPEVCPPKLPTGGTSLQQACAQQACAQPVGYTPLGSDVAFGPGGLEISNNTGGSLENTAFGPGGMSVQQDDEYTKATDAATAGRGEIYEENLDEPSFGPGGVEIGGTAFKFTKDEQGPSFGPGGLIVVSDDGYGGFGPGGVAVGSEGGDTSATTDIAYGPTGEIQNVFINF